LCWHVFDYIQWNTYESMDCTLSITLPMPRKDTAMQDKGNTAKCYWLKVGTVTSDNNNKGLHYGTVVCQNIPMSKVCNPFVETHISPHYMQS
jgi:hypothetical protein